MSEHERETAAEAPATTQQVEGPAIAGPGLSPSAARIVALQRGAGNAAVARMLARTQSSAPPPRPGSARSSGPVLARFAQGTTHIEEGRYVDGTGHAAMTEEALHGMGLDAQQARAGRQGNWMRDLSQALAPGVAVSVAGVERIVPILNIMSIKEFGRGFTAAELGTYDPVEHIDNPTDLLASDVVQQLAPGQTGAEALANPTNPDAPRTTEEVLGEGRQAGGRTGYAGADPRYAATQIEGPIMADGQTPAFDVDGSGIPRYMSTSKEWLKGKMRQAARAGRSGQGGLGPREFSSGIHTMQDYYAHSNFCEIGINILVREGVPMFVPAEGSTETPGRPDERAGGVQQFQDAGGLDTMVHGNDAQGNPLAANLMHNGREVMATGSFNLTDTAASLLEELQDKLKELNPFDKAKEGPSELTMACLDYMEMNPDNPADFSGLGRWIAGKIRSVNEVVSAVTNTGASITEGAGSLAGGAVRSGGSAVSGLLGAANSVNAFFGGDADYFAEEQRAVEGAADSAAGGVEGLTGEAAAAIRSISESIEASAVHWETQQHSARSAYQWLHEHGPLKLLKDAARRIPVVGERIVKAIETIEKQISDYVEEQLGAMWNDAVTGAVGAINAVIGEIRERTNIQDKRRQDPDDFFGLAGKFGAVGDMYDPATGRPREGTHIAPTNWTPPSHTEIAKDHGDIHNETRDQHADEPGTHDHDHDDEGDPGQEHHGDEHGHTHISSYLAPLADAMGRLASAGVGRKVAVAWDEIESGSAVSDATLAEIDREVDEWFAHPADRTFWRPEFQRALQTPRIGALVHDRITARRRATAGR